jgi:hypothetical protein
MHFILHLWLLNNVTSYTHMHPEMKIGIIVTTVEYFYWMKKGHTRRRRKPASFDQTYKKNNGHTSARMCYTYVIG